MSLLSRGQLGAHEIAWTLAAALAAGALLGFSDLVLIPLGVLAVVAMLVFGLARPALFVVVFLIARPLLDDYSNNTAGGSGLNLGGGLGVLVVVVALGYALTTKKKLVTPRASFPSLIVLLLTLAFAGWAFLNYHSALGVRPVSEIARLCALFSLYFLAVNLFGSIEGARRIVVVAALSALIPAIDGIVQWIGGAPVKENVDLGRISGPFTGPNPFGDYLAFGAIVLIALPRDWLPRGIRLAGIAVMAGALIGTYSRVGYILFLGGVLALGWRVHRLAALGAVVGAVIVVLAVPTVHDRVLPKESPASSQEQTYESFSWRLENWRGLLKQYEHSPVAGYGVETVPFVNPRVTTVNGHLSRFGGGFDAHNLAIKSLVEGGPLLLLAWAALILTFIGIALRLARDHWPLRNLGFALSVLWVLIAVISISTGEPTGESALMFALLAATGALEGAHRAWRNERLELARLPAPSPADRVMDAPPELVPA
jgi:O-antigen ligase